MSLPYTDVPTRIGDFLGIIKKAAPPDKVNDEWLSRFKFKTTSEKGIRRLFSGLGFIERSGTPTKYWHDYRDPTKSKSVLASRIKVAYGEFFESYPDAYRQSSENLMPIVISVKNISEGTATKVVNTFNKLCSFTDFSEVELDIEKRGEAIQESIDQTITTTTGLTININIQLNLPETNDVSIYSAFFKAMNDFIKNINE